jgi:hypothetical protein
MTEIPQQQLFAPARDLQQALSTPRDNPNRVKLTSTEILMAAHVGVARTVENLAKGRREQYGTTTNWWETAIEGALAECARAKWAGVYWEGVGTIHSADAADGDDTRSTSREDGCLILHPRDPDFRRFWLLIGVRGTYRVCGSILGIDGKQPQYWKDPGTGRPAFFVPQSALKFL